MESSRAASIRNVRIASRQYATNHLLRIDRSKWRAIAAGSPAVQVGQNARLSPNPSGFNAREHWEHSFDHNKSTQVTSWRLRAAYRVRLPGYQRNPEQLQNRRAYSIPGSDRLYSSHGRARTIFPAGGGKVPRRCDGARTRAGIRDLMPSAQARAGRNDSIPSDAAGKAR